MTLFPQSVRKGCNWSIRDGMSRAFACADYVIAVEDDILLAPDALLFFVWAREEYAKSDMTTVSSYCRLAPDDVSWKDGVVRSKEFFSPWGWATWKDRWTTKIEPSLRNIPAYGVWWDNYIPMHVKGKMVFPWLSRSQNIGLYGAGGRSGDVKYFTAYMHTPIWAGGLNPPPVTREYVLDSTPW